MRVYLAGPINGCSDEEANGWRTEAKNLLAGLDVYDPMVRDYRGVEDQAFLEIVEGDKADIDECDVLLVMHEKPSVGTSMEVLYAWQQPTDVFLVDRSGKPLSPWLRYHSHRIFPDLKAAADALLSRHAHAELAQ